MPEVFDYDDETNEPEIQADEPTDSTFALDGLMTFDLINA
jgi:hypothetical protein